MSDPVTLYEVLQPSAYHGVKKVGEFVSRPWCVYHDEPLTLTWSNHVEDENCEIVERLIEEVGAHSHCRRRGHCNYIPMCKVGSGDTR